MTQLPNHKLSHSKLSMSGRSDHGHEILRVIEQLRRNFTVVNFSSAEQITPTSLYRPLFGRELGTNWEQYWQRQPHAATMRKHQGGVVRALDAQTLSITATCFQYHEYGRRPGLKIRSSQEAGFSNATRRRCPSTFERRPCPRSEPTSYRPSRQAVSMREYSISVGSCISLIEPQLQFAAWPVSLSVKCANRF